MVVAFEAHTQTHYYGVSWNWRSQNSIRHYTKEDWMFWDFYFFFFFLLRHWSSLLISSLIMVLTSSPSPSSLLYQPQCTMVTQVLYAFFSTSNYMMRHLLSGFISFMSQACWQQGLHLLYFPNTQPMIKISIFFHNVRLRTFQYSLKLVSLPASSSSVDPLHLAALTTCPTYVT